MSAEIAAQVAELEARAVDAERLAADRLRLADRLADQLACAQRELLSFRQGLKFDEKVSNQRIALKQLTATVESQAADLRKRDRAIRDVTSTQAAVADLERVLGIGHPQGFALLNSSRIASAVEVVRLLAELHEADTATERISAVAGEARKRVDAAIEHAKEVRR